MSDLIKMVTLREDRLACFVFVFLQDMDMILIGAVFHWGAFSTCKNGSARPSLPIVRVQKTGRCGQHCQTSN